MKRARCALLLAALALPIAAHAQAQPDCELAIDPQLAQTLYRSISTPTADGCRLVTLATERFASEVRLTRGAQTAAPLVLASTRCLAAATVRGANLAIAVPESARALCPIAVERAVRAVVSFDFAAVDSQGFGTRNEARRSTVALLCTLLAALAACLWLTLRAPRRS